MTQKVSLASSGRAKAASKTIPEGNKPFRKESKDLPPQMDEDTTYPGGGTVRPETWDIFVLLAHASYPFPAMIYDHTGIRELPE